MIEPDQAVSSSSREARELCAELEYLWKQIKSNDASNSLSSKSPSPSGDSGRASHSNSSAVVVEIHPPEDGHRLLRLLAPNSQDDEDEENDGEDEERFEDAQEGTINDSEGDTANQAVQAHHTSLLPSAEVAAATPRRRQGSNEWRQGVEQAWAKLTAETAAVREQIDRRRHLSVGRTIFGWRLRATTSSSSSSSSTTKIVSWTISILWSALKHLVIDATVISMLFMLMFVWRRWRRWRPAGVGFHQRHVNGGGGVVDDGIMSLYLPVETWVRRRIGSGYR